MATNQDYYLQKLIVNVWHEIKTEMAKANFAAIIKCLIVVIIQLNQNTMTIQTN